MSPPDKRSPRSSFPAPTAPAVLLGAKKLHHHAGPHFSVEDLALKAGLRVVSSDRKALVRLGSVLYG